MAHFFKFHTLADLEAEGRRLDLDLRFTDDLALLFQACHIIGPLQAGNSLCVFSPWKVAMGLWRVGLMN